MDHLLAVGVFQSLGRLRDETGRLAEPGAAGGDLVREGAPLDVLAHDERNAVLLADLQHLDDPRMPQARRAASLPQKPRFLLARGERRGARNLEGDPASEVVIERKIDGPECAATQEPFHPEVTDACG